MSTTQNSISRNRLHPATPKKKSHVYKDKTAWNEPESWRAVWRGQLSPTTFKCKGSANAFLATCDYQGKLRY